MQGSRHQGVRSFNGMDTVYLGFLPCQGPLVCLCLSLSWNRFYVLRKFFYVCIRKGRLGSVIYGSSMYIKVVDILESET